VKDTIMQKFLTFAALILLVGCNGVDPGKKDEPVEITGKVTQNGKPVTGVVLNLQVLTTGTPAAIPLTANEFKFQATPGNYTWYITEGKNAAAYKSVPAAHREGAMDRTIDIGANKNFDLKIQ